MPRPAPAGPPLTLFNSLTRAAETFVPLDPAMVRLYSCGPTVYARQHLGNMRAYIFADTLTRTLRWAGYEVRHVINITDVGHLTSDADTGDDKMEKAAAAAHMSAWDIAARYTALFKDDLAKLNVVAPSHWSVATDYIDAMIDFAAQIGGSTYETPSGLYFDTTSVPDYGRLAGRRAEEDDREISRLDDVEGKRHPADFAIWRRSEQPGLRQMEWPSPWGIGAPGWHLECSVMSRALLGERFDIHTGGIDHREIHHPNEIAQNQARSGSDHSGATIWMHNNFLVERGAKMSKSSGGFATLDTLIDAGVHPLAYRLLCLSAHYRSELEFSPENVLAALTRLKRIAMAVDPLREQVISHMALADAQGLELDMKLRAVLPFRTEIIHPQLVQCLADFEAAIYDDLNTPRALVALEQTLGLKRVDAPQRWTVVEDMLGLLGLDDPADRLTRASLRLRPAGAVLTETEVDACLAERRTARVAKDFARSDTIRDELLANGVEVMDGDPLGWDWKVTL